MKRTRSFSSDSEDLLANNCSVAIEVAHQAPTISALATKNKRLKKKYYDFDHEEHLSINYALSPRTGSALLDLPRELRDMIYLLALHDTSTNFPQYTSTIIAGFGDLNHVKHVHAHHHWAHACYQLQVETIELVHKHAVFTLGYRLPLDLTQGTISNRAYSAPRAHHVPLKLELACRWGIVNCRAKQDLGFWDQSNVAAIRLPTMEDVLTLDIVLQGACRVQELYIAIEEKYPEYFYQYKATKVDFPLLDRFSTFVLGRVCISLPMVRLARDEQVRFNVQMIQHARSIVGEKGELSMPKISLKKELNSDNSRTEKIWQYDVVSAAYKQARRI